MSRLTFRRLKSNICVIGLAVFISNDNLARVLRFPARRLATPAPCFQRLFYDPTNKKVTLLFF